MDNLAKEREKYLQEKKNAEEKKKHDAHDKFKTYMVNNLDKIVVGDLKDLLIEKGQVAIEVLADGCSYSYGTLIQEGFLLKKSCYIPNADDFIWVDGIQAQYGDLLITTKSNHGHRIIYLTIAPHGVVDLIERYFAYVRGGGENGFLSEMKDNIPFVCRALVFALFSCLSVVGAISTLCEHGRVSVLFGWIFLFLLLVVLSVLYFHLAEEKKNILSQVSVELNEEIESLNCYKEIEDWKE